MKFTPDMFTDTEETVKAPAKERGSKRKRQAEPEPEEVMEPEEDENGDEEDPADEEETEEEGKKSSKVKSTLILILIILGVVILTVSIKGFVNQMRLDHGQGETGTYEDVLDEEPDDFNEVGDQQTDVETDTSVSADGSTGSSTKEDEVSALKAENEQLKEDATAARNEAATMEQELNNAKALLDASTAREAQLRSELEATSNGGK